MSKIAHILGDWSRNIGNAFFQLGGQWALNQAIENPETMLIGEQLGYPSYWNRKGGNPANSFDVISNLEVDYLVLMGPMFRPETEKIWGQALEALMAKGTRLLYLGIGAMKYDDRNIEDARVFLKKYKPHILTSRDQEIYEKLGDLATHAYDGIDFGFFMSDVYQPMGIGDRKRKMLAVNFDKIPEPDIYLKDNVSSLIKNGSFYNRTFEFEGKCWHVKFPSFRTKLSEYSRYTMFLEGILFSGNKTSSIADYLIVRPEHRPHPMIKRKSFRSPNVIVNDTPYIYAEIYNHANLTLSTRVHACVLALAYGNPALLFSKTPRSRLLDRLGLDDITSKPMWLDKKVLDQEKQSLISFLKKHL